MTFTTDELAQIKEAVRQVVHEEFLDARRSEYVTLVDIAKELGLSRVWVWKNPWCLPGKPDIDSRPKKWLRTRWDEYKQNMAEHKRDWKLRRVS